jgi:hypothetical protein
MQNKKVTMLAAVLAVTVIAMAGVGYAAVQYTATTTNTGNTMDSTYVVLTQDSGAEESAAYSGNFLTDLYFDTENKTNKDTVTYTPVYTGTLTSHVYTPNPDVTSTTADAVALISNDLTLKVTPSKANPDGATGTLKVTVSGTFTKQTDLKYIMLLTCDDADKPYKLSAEYNDGWSFASVNLDKERIYSVQLFVQMDGTTVANHTSGFAPSGSEEANKTTFKFELTVN